MIKVMAASQQAVAKLSQVDSPLRLPHQRRSGRAPSVPPRSSIAKGLCRPGTQSPISIRRASGRMVSRSTVCASLGDSAEELDQFVAVANQLADVAAEVTVPYFRTRVDVEVKADSSPVTIADKQAEAAMRQVLDKLLPDHAIFGEEAGVSYGSGEGSRYCWVIDPIDGTKSFITGKPLFGTLIALLRDGEPIVGVIDQPILKERWVGVEGRPTVLNGAPISTRPCAEIEHAYLYCTTPHMFAGESELAFNRVRDKVRIPMYGCDCYAYGLLSAGFCDLVVEADLKPYDYMALVPVIKGSGGCITDWKGDPLRLDMDCKAQSTGSFADAVVAAGDERTHSQALDALRGTGEV